MAKKIVKKIKVKKKIWAKIFAPKIFGSKELGETYVCKAEDALNRYMTISLRELTGSMRNQNVKIKLLLSELDGQQIKTKTVGYGVIANFVKKLVRKRTSRLDDVYTLRTKDGKAVQIKTLIVTYNRINRSVGLVLRSKLKSMISEELAKGDFDEFVNKVVGIKIQGSAKRTINKIFPVKEVLIREMELIDEKKAIKKEKKSAEQIGNVKERRKIQEYNEDKVNSSSLDSDDYDESKKE
jgi:small subunit ribosomal protein S3Ae